MNKAELIERIATECNLRKTTVELVLNGLGDAVTTHFADEGDGAEVTLPGLGKLKCALRAARMGRNPRTGEAIDIPERLTVRLSGSRALDETINA